MASPAWATVASKSSPGSSTVLRQWPNTSRLMAPMMAVNACSTSTTVSPGMPGRSPSADRRHGGTQLVRDRPSLLVGAEPALLVRRQQRADQRDRHPGVGLDRVLRSVIAGDGRAEDQPPLVGMLEGPAPHGARHRQPALAAWSRSPASASSAARSASSANAS